MADPKPAIPKHIAIIMDGNGRWASERGLPRIRGHLRGVSTIRSIVRECATLGVEHLTLYSFSTENWKRPRAEVSFLMSLLRAYLIKERDELHRNRVRIASIGDISVLPKESLSVLRDAMAYTANNTGMTLRIALNYSGRDELLRAFRRLAKEVQAGKLDPGAIDSATIDAALDTAPAPDPELMIRTSGELRISNFMLWQLAYSELYITEVYWPDFDKQELMKAIGAYNSRDRRFGGLSPVPQPK